MLCSSEAACSRRSSAPPCSASICSRNAPRPCYSSPSSPRPAGVSGCSAVNPSRLSSSNSRLVVTPCPSVSLATLLVMPLTRLTRVRGSVRGGPTDYGPFVYIPTSPSSHASLDVTAWCLSSSASALFPSSTTSWPRRHSTSHSLPWRGSMASP